MSKVDSVTKICVKVVKFLLVRVALHRASYFPSYQRRKVSMCLLFSSFQEHLFSFVIKKCIGQGHSAMKCILYPGTRNASELANNNINLLK